MTQNDLQPGEPRLGWFVDGDESTPQVAVLLRDTGASIEVTIPLLDGRAGSGPYSRWWSPETMFGDDPDRTRFTYGPPGVLLVHDHAGPVVLVGCRSSRAILSSGASEGVVVADYAVVGGGSLHYQAINGLRTSIPGLAEWTRFSDMDVKTGHDADGRITSVSMTLQSSPPVRLARSMGLSLRTSWSTTSSGSSFSAEETARIETRSKRSKPWAEHLRLYSAVLDLVSLSAWRPFGYSLVEVQRDDDPLPYTDGSGNQFPRWSEVQSYLLPRHPDGAQAPRFLFPYHEVARSGLQRWIALYADYAQAIQPVLGILRSESTWSATNVLRAGAALEALAYRIDLANNGGAHLNARGQMPFRVGLQVILDDLRLVPFTRTQQWIDEQTDCYMSSKHPDRAQPDPLTTVNTLRRSLLVIRFWIAQRLGATQKSLRLGLMTDPLAHDMISVG